MYSPNDPSRPGRPKAGSGPSSSKYVHLNICIQIFHPDFHISSKYLYISSHPNIWIQILHPEFHISSKYLHIWSPTNIHPNICASKYLNPNICIQIFHPDFHISSKYLLQISFTNISYKYISFKYLQIFNQDLHISSKYLLSSSSALLNFWHITKVLLWALFALVYVGDLDPKYHKCPLERKRTP